MEYSCENNKPTKETCFSSPIILIFKKFLAKTTRKMSWVSGNFSGTKRNDYFEAKFHQKNIDDIYFKFSFKNKLEFNSNISSKDQMIRI